MGGASQCLKAGVRDLAVFGGNATFENPLHVNRPNVGERELFLSYLNSAWESRWFTNDGPIVRELERRLQDYLRVKHCVLMSNGTSALALTVRALDLAGEVIIPSFTFISTAHVLHWAGIRPVFCDIDRKTWTIDCDHCAQLINNASAAVIGTHLWGRACDIQRLEKICASAGIPLLFDAAHAFGCTYGGAPIGRFGRAEVFSFHATKVFHTFEGGAITTEDDALAERLRTIRNFGFADYDKVVMAGTNAKMSEIHGAMGLTNLASIDSIIAQSKSRHEKYSDYLAGIPGLSIQPYAADERCNYQYVVAEVSAEKFRLTRDQLLQILKAENVLARRYFYPGAHRCEPYRSLFPTSDLSLPNTNDVTERVILFPGGAGIDGENVSKVCALVRFISDNAAAISAMLSEARERSSMLGQ